MNEVSCIIKDECRSLMVKHLIKALSYLPRLKETTMLDMGCGTGVPAMVVAEAFSGRLYALDQDETALDVLRQKILKQKTKAEIITVSASVFETTFQAESFDLILAEGLLNVTGFEKGFGNADHLLKKGGFFVIHDEYKDHEFKLGYFSKHHFTLLHHFTLDEMVWWEDYCKCLDEKIKALSTSDNEDMLAGLRAELDMYFKHPELFRSVYYILQKNL